ncbi:MAG TPA: hypothetical protein V6C76_07575 [Drouetiella sp.]
MDRDSARVKTAAAKPNDWSAKERETVTYRLFEVYKEFPWLLENVTSDHKLYIIRQSPADSVSRTELAEAAAGAICFNDPFFRSKLMRHTIIHELCHLNDYCSRVAHSQKWINGVEPLLAQIRMRQQFMRFSTQREYEKYLLDSGIWVSLYGANNLREALAEYISYLLEIKKCQNLTAEQKALLDQIQNPTAQQKQFDKSWFTGWMHFKNNRFKAAAEAMEEAYRLDPTSLRIKMDLISCYHNLRRHDDSKKFAALAYDQCQAIKLPSTESFFIQTLEYKGWEHMQNQQWTEALDCWNKILTIKPTEPYVLSQRATCEQWLHRFGDSLDDLYAAKGHTVERHMPLVNPLCDKEAFNSVLANFPSTDGKDHLLKAYLDTDLAKFEPDEANREKCLDEAMKELTEANKLSPELETFYMGFKLSLRNQKINEAKSFLEKIKAFESDEIRIQIAEMQFREASENSVTALGSWQFGEDTAQLLLLQMLHSEKAEPPIFFQPRALMGQDRLRNEVIWLELKQKIHALKVQPSRYPWPRYEVLKHDSPLLGDPKFLIPSAAPGNEFSLNDTPAKTRGN